MVVRVSSILVEGLDLVVTAAQPRSPLCLLFSSSCMLPLSSVFMSYALVLVVAVPVDACRSC